MRPALLALVLLVPSALAATPAGPHVVVAVGEAAHDVTYFLGSPHATLYYRLYGEAACHGEGPAQLEVDLDAGTMLLATEDDACVPGYSSLSRGCAEVASNGTLACVRDEGSTRIRMWFEASGRFVFTWDSTVFSERVEGVLARV